MGAWGAGIHGISGGLAAMTTRFERCECKNVLRKTLSTIQHVICYDGLYLEEKLVPHGYNFR